MLKLNYFIIQAISLLIYIFRCRLLMLGSKEHLTQGLKLLRGSNEDF